MRSKNIVGDVSAVAERAVVDTSVDKVSGVEVSFVGHGEFCGV